MRGQAGLPAAFGFLAYGIGEADATIHFYPPADPAHASYSALGGRDGAGPVLGEGRRLGSIMRELGHTQIDLLKLAVEGPSME